MRVRLEMEVETAAAAWTMGSVVEGVGREMEAKVVVVEMAAAVTAAMGWEEAGFRSEKEVASEKEVCKGFPVAEMADIRSQHALHPPRTPHQPHCTNIALAALCLCLYMRPHIKQHLPSYPSTTPVDAASEDL